MKKWNYLVLFTLLLWGTCFLVGCGKREQENNEKSIEIYYLNKEETKIGNESYSMQAETMEKQIDELLHVLAQTPENAEYKAPISSSITVLDAVEDAGQLTLIVDESYRNLSAITEVLTRAALVRTLTQIPGIDYISMKIREEPLADQSGNPIGVMTADMFIDNAGKEINAYEKARLTLYFTDESGTKLVETTRSVVYNSNISMEKLVVEQLIIGPMNDSAYPTINPETKVNNVTVKDGICYVNLNDSFLTQITNVTSDVTIYSITNSLVELPNVNKVQISINGDTDGMYREKIPFSTIFERNLELLE